MRKWIRHGIVCLAALLPCLLFWQSSRCAGWAEYGVEPLETTSGMGQNAEQKVDPKKATYRILFYGNSHTFGHDLPELIAEMIKSDGSDETAYVEYAGGLGFLEEAWKHPSTRPKLESLPWTHVILQAQKYSQSGKYEYSTKEAIEMAQFIQNLGAKAIFFPEWGQRGKEDEGRRVHALHESIARKSQATVAPVGLAWDRALEKDLAVKLHAADGNHQTIHGAFLTASVLYATITGRSPTKISSKVLKAFRGKDRETLVAAAEELTRKKYPTDEETSKE